jgi:hypothetical protein
MLIAWTSGASDETATSGDRRTEHRAHTRAAASASDGTDWAIHGGALGPFATGEARGPVHGAHDPSLGASVR